MEYARSSGFAVHLQADHGEMAVGKAQRGVARGGEAEKAVSPVVNGQDAFFEKGTHGFLQR